jgi:hypothetical protein
MKGLMIIAGQIRELETYIDNHMKMLIEPNDLDVMVVTSSAVTRVNNQGPRSILHNDTSRVAVAVTNAYGSRLKHFLVTEERNMDAVQRCTNAQWERLQEAWNCRPKDYSYYIKSRTDIKFHSHINIEDIPQGLVITHDTIKGTDRKQVPVYDDQFFIANHEAMEMMSNYNDVFYEYPNPEDHHENHADYINNYGVNIAPLTRVWTLHRNL